MQILRRRCLLIALVVVASISAALAQTERVYVTKTGAKYHRASGWNNSCCCAAV